MFHIKVMSPEDFDFAIRITDQMHWDLTKQDFKFMTELEPQGCFTLFSNSKRIGVATTISFAKVGWFGNLIIQKNYRRKGAGSLLVEHSIDYLKSKKVETIGLYSYIDTISFYTKLGFRYDSEFKVLRGTASPSAPQKSLKTARKSDAPQIIDFDRRCFGEDRRKLLEPILLSPQNSCYFSTEHRRVQGYLIAKAYDGQAELGPLVCEKRQSRIAINLLKATFNSLDSADISLCIASKENAIINVLKRAGFREDFQVARMFLGSPIASKCIYAAESLERG